MSAGLHATGSSNPEMSDSGRASATSLLRVVSNLVRWRRRRTFLVRHFGGQSRQGRQAAQGEQIPFSAVIIQLQRRFRLRRRGHAHRRLIGPVVVPQECRRDWWARRSCELIRLPFAPHSDPRRASSSGSEPLISPSFWNSVLSSYNPPASPVGLAACALQPADVDCTARQDTCRTLSHNADFHSRRLSS
jgi:hypothetical protein